MSFQLPDLNYGFDSLEPHIDAKTMQIHHGKHHAGYTSKLNAAVEGTDLEGKSIEDLLSNLDLSNSAVRNNGGGYYNHCLFWEIMSPNGGGSPSETFLLQLKKLLVVSMNLKRNFLKQRLQGLVLDGLGYVLILMDLLKSVQLQIKTIQ